MKLIFLPIAMHYFRLALCGIVSCSSELISACRQAYASYTLRFYLYNVMYSDADHSLNLFHAQYIVSITRHSVMVSGGSILRRCDGKLRGAKIYKQKV